MIKPSFKYLGFLSCSSMIAGNARLKHHFTFEKSLCEERLKLYRHLFKLYVNMNWPEIKISDKVSKRQVMEQNNPLWRFEFPSNNWLPCSYFTAQQKWSELLVLVTDIFFCLRSRFRTCWFNCWIQSEEKEWEKGGGGRWGHSSKSGGESKRKLWRLLKAEQTTVRFTLVSRFFFFIFYWEADDSLRKWTHED